MFPRANILYYGYDTGLIIGSGNILSPEELETYSRNFLGCLIDKASITRFSRPTALLPMVLVG